MEIEVKPSIGSEGQIIRPNNSWGNVPHNQKRLVIETILREASGLPLEDQAILLATAELESGFNPMAKAATTSAAGVFQIVKKTGQALGLDDLQRYDMESNIKAGIKLFKQNVTILARKFPGIQGDKRAVMLYALHHDGPSLQYGGAAIGNKSLLPKLRKYRKALRT